MDLLLGYELGLFGEIDRQVLSAKAENTAAGDKIVDLVERLLPNTTGFGQAGWYGELQTFVNEKASQPGSAPVSFPDLDLTLQYLETLTSGVDVFRRALPSGDTDSSTAMTRAPYDFVINYVAVGAAYPSFVLEKIRLAKGAPKSGPLGRPLTILEDLHSTRNGTDGLEPGMPKFITSTDMQKIRANIDRMNVRSDWRKILGPEIDEEFAKKSESCFGLLEEADGQYCASIYTDYLEVDLSIEDVQKVLHPRNWPHCSSFFHGVTDQNPRYAATGWSRLLETISPEPDEYLLNTALLFYFGKFDADGGIYLNYDIDPTKQRDSFLVHVDSGYICVTAPSDGNSGVRIRTSKQERVDGLSPTATSALACHMGWGQVARDMLAGTARLVRDGEIKDDELIKFEFSPPSASTLKANSGAVPVNDPAGKPVQLPANFRDTVRDTQTLANDLIARVTTMWGHAAKRWMDGMTREDVTATTREFGSNLREFADAVYTTAETDFKGKPKRPEEDA